MVSPQDCPLGHIPQEMIAARDAQFNFSTKEMHEGRQSFREKVICSHSSVLIASTERACLLFPAVLLLSHDLAVMALLSV